MHGHTIRIDSGILFRITLGILFCGLFLCGCGGDETAWIPEAGTYDVRILRDNWGVPHIFGKRDVDAAYGLAWAQCEDDWRNIEDAILLVRSRMASVHGKIGRASCRERVCHRV